MTLQRLRDERTPEARRIWAAVDKAASRVPEWVKQLVDAMWDRSHRTLKPKAQPEWSSDTTELPNEQWCWVTDGETVWPAFRDSHSSGGWTNGDCWEDFDGVVIAFVPIEKPDVFKPKTQP